MIHWLLAAGIMVTILLVLVVLPPIKLAVIVEEVTEEPMKIILLPLLLLPRAQQSRLPRAQLETQPKHLRSLRVVVQKAATVRRLVRMPRTMIRERRPREEKVVEEEEEKRVRIARETSKGLSLSRLHN